MWNTEWYMCPYLLLPERRPKPISTAFPSADLVRVRLREGHGGERHQNKGQHKTTGFHDSFSLRNSFLPDLGSGLFAGSVTCDQSALTNAPSYTVIVNYNTISDVKQFLFSSLPAAIHIGQVKL